jgi:ABC-type sugar transport system ATPase subunit
MTTDSSPHSLAARCIAVTKRFGDTVALRNISISVPSGQIHGLVGENGAGKSTCFGLMAGRYAPTSGTVEVLGRALSGRGPREAREAGVCAIYQELSFAPTMSATENAFLGQEASGRLGRLRRREMRARFAQLADEFRAAIDPDARMADLPLAAAQLVEIIRSLTSNARLIMYDEPTTSLSIQDRDRLYQVMRSLRSRGPTQLFVSHNLGEVLALCDAVTVFRDGRVVESRTAADWSKRELVTAMIGSAVKASRRPAQHHDPTATTRLQVTHPVVRGRRWELSLAIEPGEVVGIAGLTGSGRSSLLRAIAGADPRASGSMSVDGKPVRWPTRVSRASRHGIGLIPEDRKSEGLLPHRPGIDSLLLGGYRTVAWRGLLSLRRNWLAAEAAAGKARLDPSRLSGPAGTLSGGNQQKVLVARWIHRAPGVLLCDEPTRGVDIAARAEIWETLYGMAAAGTALLVVSSDFDELTDHCHRIVIIAGRRVADEMRPNDENFTSERILRAIFEHTGVPATASGR